MFWLASVWTMTGSGPTRMPATSIRGTDTSVAEASPVTP
jgi:hypothetical protein